MTSDQILLVRSTWYLVAERPDVLSGRFYHHLFSIDHSAARLFGGIDMTAQRVKFVQSLAVVVGALDDLDTLLPAVAELGKRHARYGVELRHFDSVEEALLHAFSDTLGDAFTPELHSAWTEAYAFVASVMKRALLHDSLRQGGPIGRPGEVPSVA